MEPDCTPIFRELGDDFMRLPSQGEVFDCVAAERMFTLMGAALLRILALQRKSLTAMLDETSKEERNAEILVELERTTAIVDRLESHQDRLHNFFLQPHLYDSLDDLTLVRKETLDQLNQQLTELCRFFGERRYSTHASQLVDQQIREVDQRASELVGSLQELYQQRQVLCIEREHSYETSRIENENSVRIFAELSTRLRNLVGEDTRGNPELSLRRS